MYIHFTQVNTVVRIIPLHIQNIHFSEVISEDNFCRSKTPRACSFIAFFQNSFWGTISKTHFSCIKWVLQERKMLSWLNARKVKESMVRFSQLSFTRGHLLFKVLNILELWWRNQVKTNSLWNPINHAALR